MITYIDTSALVKLLVVEPGSDEVATIWDAATSVAAVQLIEVEARAALASAAKSQRISSTQHDRAKASLNVFLGQLSLVEVTASLVNDASEVAETELLRGYDAVHLASAELVGAAAIASADARLCAAAARRGLAVANPLDGSDD